MGDLRISYVPREDATAQGEIATLAAVYAYILECNERNKGAGTENGSEGEDVTERNRTGGIVSEERP